MSATHSPQSLCTGCSLCPIYSSSRHPSLLPVFAHTLPLNELFCNPYLKITTPPPPTGFIFPNPYYSLNSHLPFIEYIAYGRSLSGVRSSLKAEISICLFTDTSQVPRTVLQNPGPRIALCCSEDRSFESNPPLQAVFPVGTSKASTPCTLSAAGPDAKRAQKPV